jgi:CarD family transcriptional regulator
MVQAKMKKKIKRLYKTRELVVYPSHGVGKVIGVEEQEIGGDVLEVYVILSFSKETT